MEKRSGMTDLSNGSLSAKCQGIGKGVWIPPTCSHGPKLNKANAHAVASNART